MIERKIHERINIDLIQKSEISLTLQIERNYCCENLLYPLNPKHMHVVLNS